MNKKLFVANFRGSTENKDLQKLFSRFGKVRTIWIERDWKTGESERWGLVEMDDEDDAACAVRELDGTIWRGQRLKVRHASPPSARERWR